MYTVVLCLLLLQNADYAPATGSAAGAAKRETQLREVATALSHPPPASASEETAKEYAAAQDREFVGKFNTLIGKLVEFSESYKAKNAIDVKKAAAVRKAWLELERAEALFREDPKR